MNIRESMEQREQKMLRDHAPDGFTGHCWVRIDNRYYDPEADWAGWMTGVYGYNSYPIRHYVKKIYNFMR